MLFFLSNAPVETGLAIHLALSSILAGEPENNQSMPLSTSILHILRIWSTRQYVPTQVRTKP
jgi:hypothetical protein